MTLKHLAGTVLLLLAPLGAMANGVQPPVPSKNPAALQLPDVNGKTRQLKEWQGRPVLLNYWATWCGPCLKEMPELQAFAKTQSPKGVQVVGIALDEPADIKAYLGRVPVSYPILIEAVEAGEPGSSGTFGNRHGVLPYSVLLDARGQVVKTKAGPLTEKELQAWAALIPAR